MSFASAYDASGSYLDMTCFTMPSNSFWLLATLNSDLVEFLMCQITNSLRGGFLRPKRNWMIQLPIVIPDTDLRELLESTAILGIEGQEVDTQCPEQNGLPNVRRLRPGSRANQQLVRPA